MVNLKITIALPYMQNKGAVSLKIFKLILQYFKNFERFWRALTIYLTATPYPIIYAFKLIKFKYKKYYQWNSEFFMKMLKIYYVTQKNIVKELSQTLNPYWDILKRYINTEKMRVHIIPGLYWLWSSMLQSRLLQAILHVTFWYIFITNIFFSNSYSNIFIAYYN